MASIKSSASASCKHKQLSAEDKLKDMYPECKPINAPGKESRKITHMGELKMGDHIAAYRPWTIIPIYHHGIYVGDGKVIDYCDDGSAERSFADFKDGCYVYVIIHPNPLDPSEIVKGARAALTEYKKKYHVLWNNCENFATAIVTGKGFSLQTERATGYMVFGGISIAISLVLASLIPESKKQ